MQFNYLKGTLLSAIASIAIANISAQEIQRFEYFSSEDGLSQNTVYSMYSDDNGFLWLGTMNGLNRYDGAKFTVYRNFNDNSDASINSRINRIWQDAAGFIWNETYDGCYQFFNQRTEEFTTVPKPFAYSVEQATAFLQYDDSTIFVGADSSGIYRLTLENNIYKVENFEPFSQRIHVTAICKDLNGLLYVASSSGLAVFSPKQAKGNCEPLRVLPNINISGPAVESSTHIFFPTRNEGIIRIDKSTIESQRFGKFTNVISLARVDNDNIAAATADAKLFLVDITSPIDAPTVAEIHYHGTGTNLVEKLYVDNFRQLWITTAQPGVTRYSAANNLDKYYKLTPDYLSASIDHERPFFFEDSQNAFWIGLHGGGLLKYDRLQDAFTAKLNNIDDPNSIPSNIVHCIAEDKAGQLWIGTGQYRGGLAKVVTENRAFTNIVADPGARSQTDNVVRCIWEDPAQNIWVALKSGKIVIYNSQFKVIRRIDALKTTNNNDINSVVYAMLLDSAGRLWVGTKGEGLFVSEKNIDFGNIASEKMRFTYCSALPDASPAEQSLNNNVYSMVQDSHGNIWVATYGNGLNRLQFNDETGATTVTVWKHANSGILSDKVRYLYKDKVGDIWVATTSGVSRIDSKELEAEHYLETENFPQLKKQDICHIYEDAAANKYFATIGGGLSILKPNGDKTYQCQTLTTREGLCNNAVYSISEDNTGNIWLTTENGITCMNLEHNTFEAFNTNTGLFFNSFSESTCCRLSTGKIAFGGYKGLITVAPLQLINKPYNGNIVLTAFYISNKEQHANTPDSPLKENITFAQDVSLRHSQNSISIEFRSLDFTDPENIHYAYKLDGVDDDWNYVSNLTRATYTNLKPDKYVFHVKATTRNGQWSDNIRSLNITIRSPWWATIPAIVAYIIIIIAIIYAIITIFARQTKIRQELAMTKNINEIKLQFFTNIAHEIRTPLTLIVSPVETLLSSHLPRNVNDQLLIIKRSTNRMLLLINQLLDFRKVQNRKMQLSVSEENVGLFVEEIGQSFRPLAEQKKLIYTIDTPKEMKLIWVDTQCLDTIIYNLLSNAIKFTDEGKEVSLSVMQDLTHTYIKVADHGRGIKDVNPDVLFKRYTILSSHDFAGTGIGLSITYEFVHLMGGELTVSSKVGEGSIFTVKLPNDKEHYESDPTVKFIDHAPNNKIVILPDLPKDNEGEAAVDQTNPAEKNTLLLVEDNADILQYLSTSLKREYNCLTANNGQVALVTAKEKIPDLIITDLMMPEMDGETMIQHLKDNVETSHIPIIALTAKADKQTEIEVYKHGIDAYITKPFNIEHIKAIADNLLKKRQEFAKQLIEEQTQSMKIPAATSEGRVPEGEAIAPSPQTAPSRLRGENQSVDIKILSKDEEFIRQLVKKVEDNYRADLSIDKLAEEFSMSRTVFYNKVKSLTGQSPLEFVRQIKFKIAEQLLDKGYNVSEVAFELGYSDVKYFSKQFRTIFGYPPSQYKKHS